MTTRFARREVGCRVDHLPCEQRWRIFCPPVCTQGPQAIPTITRLTFARKRLGSGADPAVRLSSPWPIATCNVRWPNSLHPQEHGRRLFLRSVLLEAFGHAPLLRDWLIGRGVRGEIDQRQVLVRFNARGFAPSCYVLRGRRQVRSIDNGRIDLLEVTLKRRSIHLALGMIFHERVDKFRYRVCCGCHGQLLAALPQSLDQYSARRMPRRATWTLRFTPAD